MLSNMDSFYRFNVLICPDQLKTEIKNMHVCDGGWECMISPGCSDPQDVFTALVKRSGAHDVVNLLAQQHVRNSFIFPLQRLVRLRPVALFFRASSTLETPKNYEGPKRDDCCTNVVNLENTDCAAMCTSPYKKSYRSCNQISKGFLYVLVEMFFRLHSSPSKRTASPGCFQS